MKSTTSKARDALLSAIFKNPEDDEKRLVLADALLELGDPRGEFIVEQGKRLASGKQNPSTKERALQKRHRDEWLGPIAPLLKQETFRLGFVSVAALRSPGFESRLLRAREWRTVERLDLGNHRNVGATSEKVGAAVLSRADLVSLREVSTVFVELIEQAAQANKTTHWTSLSSVNILNPRSDFAALSTLDDALTRLTRIECVDAFMEGELDDDEVDSGQLHAEFLRSRLATRLEFVVLRTSNATLEMLARVALEANLRAFEFSSSEQEWKRAGLRWDGRVLTVSGPINPSLPGIRIERFVEEENGR